MVQKGSPMTGKKNVSLPTTPKGRLKSESASIPTPAESAVTPLKEGFVINLITPSPPPKRANELESTMEVTEEDERQSNSPPPPAILLLQKKKKSLSDAHTKDVSINLDDVQGRDVMETPYGAVEESTNRAGRESDDTPSNDVSMNQCNEAEEGQLMDIIEPKHDNSETQVICDKHMYTISEYRTINTNDDSESSIEILKQSSPENESDPSPSNSICDDDDEVIDDLVNNNNNIQYMDILEDVSVANVDNLQSVNMLHDTNLMNGSASDGTIDSSLEIVGSFNDREYTRREMEENGYEHFVCTCPTIFYFVSFGFLLITYAKCILNILYYINLQGEFMRNVLIQQVSPNTARNNNNNNNNHNNNNNNINNMNSINNINDNNNINNDNTVTNVKHEAEEDVGSEQEREEEFNGSAESDGGDIIILNNDNDNNISDAQLHGAESSSQNAELSRVAAPTIVIAPLGPDSLCGSSTPSTPVSTRTAHPGDSNSRVLLQSAEYRHVWQMYPSEDLRDFANHVYKYAHISPLITNANQLMRLLSGLDSC